MTPRFGPVMQLGFVVPDLDRAMEHWTGNVGVGPFYVLQHIQFAEALYRGQPTDADISVAVAQWGEVQVELIQQFNDSPFDLLAFPVPRAGRPAARRRDDALGARRTWTSCARSASNRCNSARRRTASASPTLRPTSTRAA